MGGLACAVLVYRREIWYSTGFAMHVLFWSDLAGYGGACWFCMVGGRLWWAAATPFHGAGSKNTSKTYLSSLTPKKIYRSENPKVKHCNYASHLPFLYLPRPHSSSLASRSIARLETILTSPSSIPTKKKPTIARVPSLPMRK